MLFHCAVLCCAATVVLNPHLRSGDHPPSPRLDRVLLAEAEPQQAGTPGPRPSRKGETFAELVDGSEIGIAAACRYVNGTVAELARRPGAEAREERYGTRKGRARLCRPRLDPDDHRPNGRGLAVLLRKAPAARRESAGHRQPGRRCYLGVPAELTTAGGSPLIAATRARARRFAKGIHFLRVREVNAVIWPPWQHRRM